MGGGVHPKVNKTGVPMSYINYTPMDKYIINQKM